jgi:hypothetical protein
MLTRTGRMGIRGRNVVQKSGVSKNGLHTGFYMHIPKTAFLLAEIFLTRSGRAVSVYRYVRS